MFIRFLILFILLFIGNFCYAAEPNIVDEIDIISLLGSEDDEGESITGGEEKIDELLLDPELKKTDAPLVSDDPKSLQQNNSQAFGQHFKPFALVRVLNKITTKSVELKIAKGKTSSFGKLQIELAYCWQSPPDQDFENKAYLNLAELMNSNEVNKIFSGWILSSSPSLSEIQHPIYDVHLIKCLD
jgi:hypothetical protein